MFSSFPGLSPAEDAFSSNSDSFQREATENSSTINKTAVCCWSPASFQSCYLACGTVAGALDSSFSTSAELAFYQWTTDTSGSLWKQICSMPSSLKFCRLAWSSINAKRSIVAGGMEAGTLSLWNATDALQSSTSR